MFLYNIAYLTKSSPTFHSGDLTRRKIYTAHTTIYTHFSSSQIFQWIAYWNWFMDVLFSNFIIGC